MTIKHLLKAEIVRYIVPVNEIGHQRREASLIFTVEHTENAETTEKE